MTYTIITIVCRAGHGHDTGQGHGQGMDLSILLITGVGLHPMRVILGNVRCFAQSLILKLLCE